MTDRELLELAQEAITWASDRLDPIGDPCTCPLCAAEIALHMRLERKGNGGKTGWAPGMLQDDDRKLSQWLANRPGARRDAMTAQEEPDYKALYEQMCERCDELDKRLAREEQEPVGVVATDTSNPHVYYGSQYVGQKQDARIVMLFKGLPLGTPVYTAPQPAVRKWVGLTEEEVEDVFFDMGQFAKVDLKTFARAIEAKLKEKNGGGK